VRVVSDTLFLDMVLVSSPLLIGALHALHTLSSRNTSHPAIYSAQNQLVQTTRRRLPR
jgi:hypothetical protein